MNSPSSKVRRRAWINSSRHWPTLEDLDPEGPLQHLGSASIADDDVFSEGCVTGKIETWLQRCGSGVCLENTAQLSFESVLKAGNPDDDLSLGADASVLNGEDLTFEVGLARQFSSKRHHSTLISSTPRPGLCLPSLNLGHSMASSCLSSSTFKTTSSVSDILQMRSEDAEETLYELGFGCDEPQVTVRIPPRFFTFPSQAQGINFRLFLDAQIRRIREEDPSLSLASRFRQVQVLTAMANAFYSLYSHVSRTPLQKLVTPEFTFSSPMERIERFRSSVRSEPRSPVERLKDTVSKMCLYTGSPRGSDSTSPQSSPKKRASLPDVVGAVLKVRPGVSRNLELGEHNRSISAVDVRLVIDSDKASDFEKEEQAGQILVETDLVKNRNKIYQTDTKSSKQTHDVDAENLKDSECSIRTSLASSLSGDTVIEMYHQPVPSCKPALDSGSSQSDTMKVDPKPAAKVAYDLICPQIVESVHQAPFYCQHKHNPKTDADTEKENRSASGPGSYKPNTKTCISEPEEDSCVVSVASFRETTQTDASRSEFSVLAPRGSYTHYSITVTGWEKDTVSSSSLKTPDSSHSSSVPHVQTCEESLSKGTSQYLNPLTHRGLGHISNNLQQVNSFELEEVHSAGEDDFGQSESTRTTPSPSFSKHQCKGEVARGDSMQSDSSGYAD